MKKLEDIPLVPLTTFRMGPRTRFLIEIEREEEVPAALAFAREQSQPLTILSGGSNTIFTGSDRYDGVILKVGIKGIETVADDPSGTTLRVGAGEIWDDVVAYAVGCGLSGIEALSAIPGLAGATPVQNVGAYGAEIADVLVSLRAYDYKEGKFVELDREACGFAYRDSIFKYESRHLITSITIRLSKEPPKIPAYPGVQEYFESAGITEPSLSDIRKAITEIRWKKLPDPKDVASVGSFFKNPFVDEPVVTRLRKEFEKPIIFDVGEGKYKVGAGWLIDQLGLKGKSFGHLSLYPNNALVIVNDGGATYAELAELIASIQAQVHERYGISIEPEPVFV